MSKKSVIKTKVDPKIAVIITVLTILIVGIFVIATIIPSSRLSGFYAETTIGDKSLDNCTVANVHFDESGWSSPEKFSLTIYPPAGCDKPYGNAGNVDITTSGSYICSGGARYYDTDVKINSDAVVFTAKCSIFPHYIETSNHFITVKFLPSTPPTPGYYCNRSINPLMPKCEYRTTGTGNTTQAQCLTSCQPDSQYYANISHHKVGQTEPKRAYEIGEKIEFVGATNAGGTNNRYSWNFGDNMWTSGTSLSYAPVIYKTPGIKKVTFRVTNVTGQSYIATSIDVKVKCTPPSNAVPGDQLITITSYLNNNYMVKIAANNFREWANNNKQAISDAMDQYQCEYVGRDKVTEYRTLRAIQWIKNITDAKQIAILKIQQLMPSAGQNTIISHAVIALKVTDITNNFETRYSIDFLDPNGPVVFSMDCKISKKKIWDVADNTVKLQTAMFCLHPTLDLVFPSLSDVDTKLIESLRTKFYQECNLSQTSFCQERRNLGLWLRNNYPLISNFAPAGTRGVCRGWSEFVSKVSYLGDFAGECASF